MKTNTSKDILSAKHKLMLECREDGYKEALDDVARIIIEHVDNVNWIEMPAEDLLREIAKLAKEKK
jgi:hypothetical protein